MKEVRVNRSKCDFEFEVIKTFWNLRNFRFQIYGYTHAHGVENPTVLVRYWQHTSIWTVESRKVLPVPCALTALSESTICSNTTITNIVL